MRLPLRTKKKKPKHQFSFKFQIAALIDIFFCHFNRDQSNSTKTKILFYCTLQCAVVSKKINFLHFNLLLRRCPLYCCIFYLFITRHLNIIFICISSTATSNSRIICTHLLTAPHSITRLTAKSSHKSTFDAQRGQIILIGYSSFFPVSKPI